MRQLNRSAQRPGRRAPRGLAALALCAALSGAALLLSAAPAAKAARLIQPQVVGLLTAISGSTAVTVNGHTYLIAPGSSAYQTIQSHHVGETVGLVLNGPPDSSGSQVIAIQVQAGSP